MMYKDTAVEVVEIYEKTTEYYPLYLRVLCQGKLKYRSRLHELHRGEYSLCVI